MVCITSVSFGLALTLVAMMQTWNMRHLDSLLTRVLEDRLPGVNTPYLYFGMWRSFFGWYASEVPE